MAAVEAATVTVVAGEAAVEEVAAGAEVVTVVGTTVTTIVAAEVVVVVAGAVAPITGEVGLIWAAGELVLTEASTSRCRPILAILVVEVAVAIVAATVAMTSAEARLLTRPPTMEEVEDVVVTTATRRCSLRTSPLRVASIRSLARATRSTWATSPSQRIATLSIRPSWTCSWMFAR